MKYDKATDRALLLREMEATCRVFTGKFHGTDADGVTDIEFDDLIQATRFVIFTNTKDKARIRDDGNGVTVSNFTSTVVIQFEL